MERYRQLLKQEHGFRSVLSDRGYYAEEARTSLALCRWYKPAQINRIQSITSLSMEIEHAHEYHEY